MTCVVKAQFGIVDSDDGRSSAVGWDILKNGGNAVDAAVAVTLCLGVINQGSSGLGGGSFMLVRMNDDLKNLKIKGYDMREIAPSAANEAYYRQHPEMQSKGPMSVTVPGELKGLRMAWEDFGSMEWSKLVEPAIRFAEEGFTISPYLHRQMNIVEKDIRSDPGMRAIYMRNNQLLKPGDVCKNPQLAGTLKAIARHGADVFYKGEVGENLVQDIREAGGIMTRNDLKNYEVVERDPITGKVFGFDFLTMPPPASGGAGMLLMLNFLTNYGSPIDKEFIWFHRFIESCKHMFAVRTHLGDPKFDDIKEVLKDMLSQSFAAELRKDTSDDHTFPPSHYGGKWHIDSDSEVIKDHGTSHMSIVDCHGNAVALTSSVNWYFGSRFLSPRTGILLNDTMDDFFLPKKVPPPYKKVANRIQPNKRPLSSMTPTIILKDGNLKAVVGSSGGFRIIAGTTQVLLNHFAKGMDLLTSIMQPRIFDQLLDEDQKEGYLEYEDWYTAKHYHFVVDKRERDYLQAKGNTLKALHENNMCQFIEVPIPFPNRSASNIVAANKPVHITGASDPRKGSYPAGY